MGVVVVVVLASSPLGEDEADDGTELRGDVEGEADGEGCR
jgi:hypothetical protein